MHFSFSALSFVFSLDNEEKNKYVTHVSRGPLFRDSQALILWCSISSRVVVQIWSVFDDGHFRK